MVAWLTGNSGAGKTTIARNVKAALDAAGKRSIILDGNEMRDSISVGAGFSKEDREAHNLRVARLAKVLEPQVDVVLVSVIAPFPDARAKIAEICDPTWVHVKRQLPEDPDRPYHPPDDPALTIDNDTLSPSAAADKLLNLLSLTK